MKRIVIFGEALTYPPKEGITAHVFSLLEALSAAECEPILVLSDRGFISREQIERFPWRTVLVPPSDFYDVESMTALVRSLRPDVLQSYNVYQARLIGMPIAYALTVPFVFEHHDLENTLATFLGLPEHLAQDNTAYQSDILNFALVNRVMSKSDYSRLMSVSSAENKARLTWLPVGIKSENKPQRKGVSKGVLFVGNGAYPPNEQAIRKIILDIAPNNLELDFHIVGRLSVELCKQLNSGSNVKAHGQVDDLATVASQCFAGVAPVVAGSGMKVKVMTYMALGLPVVGSSLAFDGYEPAKYFFTAEDGARYTEAFGEIISDFSKLSKAASKDFTEQFEVGAITKKMLSIYNQLPEVGSFRYGHLPASISRDDKRLAWIHESRENIFTPVTELQTVGGSR